MAKFGSGGSEDPPAKPTLRSTQISEPRCKVCQSPNRKHIDKALALGITSAAQVAKHFSIVDGVNYTRQNMSSHKDKHLTLRQDAMVRLIEKRAKEEGRDVDDVAGTLLTERAVLETMIQKGFEQIVDGKVYVTPGDLLAALTKLKNAEIEFYQAKLQHVEQQMTAEMDAFIDAVKKTIPEVLFKRVLENYEIGLDQLRQNQVLEIETGQDDN